MIYNVRKDKVKQKLKMNYWTNIGFTIYHATVIYYCRNKTGDSEMLCILTIFVKYNRLSIERKTFSHAPPTKASNIMILHNAFSHAFCCFKISLQSFQHIFFRFCCSCLIPSYDTANPWRGISITNFIMASTMDHMFLSVL